MSTVSNPAAPQASSRTAGRRRKASLFVLLAVLLLGGLLRFVPDGQTPVPLARSVAQQGDGASFSKLNMSPVPAREVAEIEEPVATLAPEVATPADRLLRETRQLIKERRYEEAIRRLDAQRPALQQRPEAFVQLGRALEGRGDAATARDFYFKAISMDPMQSEAYWGYATASETLGDFVSALGAMRSYLHTDRNPDPKRLRIAQARSAIWEWESQLGRGPWGPTKGIMPGLTAAQQKRDGRGVAGLDPIPGTEGPDGIKQFRIVHQDKFRIFDEN